ncbi:unnamed protein product [Ilex paraguariensis]|uniref:Uncharacterized protein n=1 Tax=Ilex paraguariensis TaxID=185542 RepID=A0ABC8SKA5_9AQUA
MCGYMTFIWWKEDHGQQTRVHPCAKEILYSFHYFCSPYLIYSSQDYGFPDFKNLVSDLFKSSSERNFYSESSGCLLYLPYCIPFYKQKGDHSQDFHYLICDSNKKKMPTL